MLIQVSISYKFEKSSISLSLVLIIFTIGLASVFPGSRANTMQACKFVKSSAQKAVKFVSNSQLYKYCKIIFFFFQQLNLKCINLRTYQLTVCDSSLLIILNLLALIPNLQPGMKLTKTTWAAVLQLDHKMLVLLIAPLVVKCL